MFSAFWNTMGEKVFQTGLHEVRVDIKNRLEDLHRIFVVDNQGADYPVAFATNAMYVLAREDGQSQLSREIIEGTLLPVVKAKAHYLHGEGLAQMAYALNEYQIWDEEAWALLREHIPQHRHVHHIVKNHRWGLKYFIDHNGSEHLLQQDINRFGNMLFYKGKSFASS
jgi:hypothetical protein